MIARHAEIGHFQLPAIVHEEVGRLQVAVQDPIGVQVVDRGGELEEKGLDLRGEEGLLHFFLQRFEVVFDEIHDKEDAGLEDQFCGSRR